MSIEPAQRRTVIIRGRGQTELDTLLPLFAALVERSTPKKVEDFVSSMLVGLQAIFPGQTTKTYRNYLTETIGQLFAMYYIEDGLVEISPLTLKLLGDGDQPAFFKVLVSRMQFPNPMAKKNKYDLEVADGLSVKPLVLVLEVLNEARKNNNDRVSFSEIAYFILNSEPALQGKHESTYIYSVILRSRIKKLALPQFTGSRERQHIKESLSLLVLANLVRTDGELYWTNDKEAAVIEEICLQGSKSSLFRLRQPLEDHEIFQQAWKKNLTDYSTASPLLLETDVSALGAAIPKVAHRLKSKKSTHDIGREGELLVLDYENKALESAFKGKGVVAIDYTAKRGIGFDIESVFHDDPTLLGKAHRIEVKSTLRVTKPALGSSPIPDSFNLTRSEKQAIEIYGDTFSVYRVYLYAGGYIIQILRNPALLGSKGVMKFTPENWTAEYMPSVLGSEHRIHEVTT